MRDDAFNNKAIDTLLSIIGRPPEGSHPSEWLPRARTWHEERLNWQEEVRNLRAEIERLKRGKV